MTIGECPGRYPIDPPNYDPCDGESRCVKKYKSIATGRIVFQRTVIDESQYELLPSDAPKKRFVYYFDGKHREAARNQGRYSANRRAPLSHNGGDNGRK